MLSAACMIACALRVAVRLPRSAPTRLGVPKRTPELAGQLEDQILEWGGDKPIHRYAGRLLLAPEAAEAFQAVWW